MNICIVTKDYPDARRSTYEFVKQLVVEWADMGHNCVVVAPFSKHQNDFIREDEVEIQTTTNGNIIKVIRPIYAGEDVTFCGKNIFYLLHGWALNKGLKKIGFRPDIIYAHFWAYGLEAFPFAKLHKIPLIVASGEAEVPTKYANKLLKPFVNYVSGAICVSTKTQDECLTIGLTTKEKSLVIPNAFNPVLFPRLDRMECRKKLGYAKDDFILIFVGDFGDRKGCMRVSEAITTLNDPGVKSIFIGKGENNPDCPGILFKGSIKHELLNTYLQSSDVFILPTLNEGCCNAIVEAIACGLPVISSDLPFNYDILDNKNSILVNPLSIKEIANAIRLLKNNPELRKEMAERSLERASSLSITLRASAIINFIRESVS